MKKTYFLLVLAAFLVIILSGCTVGGIEAGLIGTWNLVTGEWQDAKDFSGTMVINYDDTFTQDVKFTYGDSKGTLKGSGTLTGNCIDKTMVISYDDFEVKVGGIVWFDEPDDNNCTYIYSGNILITVVEGEDGQEDMTFTWTR